MLFKKVNNLKNYKDKNIKIYRYLKLYTILMGII